MNEEQETAQNEQGSKKKFLLSYTDSDRQWVEWIRWHLEDLGYTTALSHGDSLPGSNQVFELHRATNEAERIIAIISSRYIHTLYMHPEWATAFRSNETDEERRFIPIRVEACDLTGFLEHIVPIDLTGLDRDRSTARLREAIQGARLRPLEEPHFPGTQPAYKGSPPRRNHFFVGRENTLKTIHRNLQKEGIVAIVPTVDAVDQKGIGKTQIAIEYMYRYQSNYEFILWIRSAMQADRLMQSLTDIAHGLQLVEKETEDGDSVIRALKEWLTTQSDWLLIFDGVEHVQIIKDLVPNQHSGHILLTTRERSIATIAPLIEIRDLTQEEKERLQKLENLVNAALHNENGKHFHLGLGSSTIGTAPDNTIQMPDDPSVEEHHAVIFLGKDYHITDLGSREGTFVNNQRLEPHIPHRLGEKDKIRIGEVWLAYASDTAHVVFPQREQRIQTHPVLPAPVQIEPSDKTRQTALLDQMQPSPVTRDPLDIVRQVQQGNALSTWRVFRNQKIAFQDVVYMVLDLDVAMKRALILFAFLAITCVPLMIAIASGDGGFYLSFLFLLTFLLDTCAAVYFAVLMARSIAQTPAISMEPTNERPLLILMPEGFIEYIDTNEELNSVLFADLVTMQFHLYEDYIVALDLLYRDGPRRQWYQRANFGSSAFMSQQIFDAFVQYVQNLLLTPSQLPSKNT